MTATATATRQEIFFLAERVGNSTYKAGATSDWDAAQRLLDAGPAWKALMVVRVNNAEQLERLIARKFKQQQMSDGEWFALSSDHLQFVRSLAQKASDDYRRANPKAAPDPKQKKPSSSGQSQKPPGERRQQTAGASRKKTQSPPKTDAQTEQARAADHSAKAKADSHWQDPVKDQQGECEIAASVWVKSWLNEEVKQVGAMKELVAKYVAWRPVDCALASKLARSAKSLVEDDCLQGLEKHGEYLSPLWVGKIDSAIKRLDGAATELLALTESFGRKDGRGAKAGNEAKKSRIRSKPDMGLILSMHLVGLLLTGTFLGIATHKPENQAGPEQSMEIEEPRATLEETQKDTEETEEDESLRTALEHQEKMRLVDKYGCRFHLIMRWARDEFAEVRVVSELPDATGFDQYKCEEIIRSKFGETEAERLKRLQELVNARPRNVEPNCGYPAVCFRQWPKADSGVTVK